MLIGQPDHGRSDRKCAERSLIRQVHRGTHGSYVGLQFLAERERGVRVGESHFREERCGLIHEHVAQAILPDHPDRRCEHGLSGPRLLGKEQIVCLLDDDGVGQPATGPLGKTIAIEVQSQALGEHDTVG